MSSDSVPNIRLKVAKTVKEVLSHITDPNHKDQIKTSLRVLNKDEDVDVRYYAEIAIRGI